MHLFLLLATMNVACAVQQRPLTSLLLLLLPLAHASRVRHHSLLTAVAATATTAVATTTTADSSRA
jgi:hypothetical protein